VPRQARLDAPGTLHHVIIRGIEKKNIVTNQYDRKDFVERLGNLATETETGIYAWALLSNHAHILLCSSDAGLAHFMRRLLTGYAINYNLRHKRHGHLFQNRYKSIICEENINMKELRSGSRRQPVSRARALIANYIVKNFGVTLAEAARRLGVSTSAVSKMLNN